MNGNPRLATFAAFSDMGPKHWKNWLDTGILQSDGTVRSKAGAARSGLGPNAGTRGQYPRDKKTYKVKWYVSDHDQKILERLRYLGDVVFKPSLSSATWHEATLSSTKNLRQVKSLMNEWLSELAIRQER